MNPYTFITTLDYLNHSTKVDEVLAWLFENGHDQLSAARWLAEFTYPHFHHGELFTRVRVPNHPNYAWVNLIPPQYFLNPALNKK